MDYENDFNLPIHEPDYTDGGEFAWHLCELLGERGGPYYAQAWSGNFGEHIYKSNKAYIHGPHHGIDGHIYVNGPVTIEVQVSRDTAEKIMAILAEEWQPDTTAAQFCSMQIRHGPKSRHCWEPRGHEGPHKWGKEI
jgi:hypothetical protein